MGEKIVIQTLTDEEIQNLQVDAALRLLGTYSKQLGEVNSLIVDAMRGVLSAKCALQELQGTKETLTEMMRAMKTIAQNS